MSLYGQVCGIMGRRKKRRNLCNLLFLISGMIQRQRSGGFYVDLFGGNVDWTYTITDTPSGDSDLIQFQLGI